MKIRVSLPPTLQNYVELSRLAVFAMVIAIFVPRTGNAQSPLLEEFIQEALTNNSEILSLEESARALRAEAPFAGSLENPRIGFAIANLPTDTFSFDQEAMTQKQISFAQKIPWFGKLDLAQQAAELKAVEQEHMVEAKRLSVRRQIKDAWYELSFAEQSIDINRKLNSIVTQVQQIAETRYATGEGVQQDILLAQVKQSELLDERVSLESRARMLQDRIGELLNREELLSVSSDQTAIPDISWLEPGRLVEVGLKNNPLITARRAAVMQAEAKAELAAKDYMPDMDLKVSYGQRDEDPVTGKDRADFISAGVTLSVPLWQGSRQDSKYEGSIKRLASAKKSLLALERSLPHRIDGLLAEIEGALETRQLYLDEITVQAAQLADSSLAAYSVGKVEFSTMLSARVRLLQVELKAHRYEYLICKKLAELEETVGMTIEAMREIG